MDSKKNIDGLKVLLLQIRENEVVRREEHESFADYAGLDKSQVDIHNVFDHPTFDPDVVSGYDALFIGGASEASVLEPETYTFLSSCIDLIHHVIDKKIPTFASCFGFQLAVIALGGEVFRDTENFEMGTLPISLADAAQSDPVYSNISNNFKAVSVHQESTRDLPEGCVTLAFTEMCLHSFKVIEAPFWAFQFHPELDKPRLSQRLEIYKEKYTEDKEHFENIIASLEETPESNRLVQNFVQSVLLD
jgi:GMP synthase (glutamine-hydrolysing)